MKKQLTLNLYRGTHGGRRPNSGKKRKHSPGVSHKGREEIKPIYPLHVNFKYNTYIKSEAVFEIFIKSLRNARSHGIFILQYSIQSNHIHLIIEAESNSHLETGMRSLTSTMVKLIQSLKHITGPIQIERYHLHVLKTPAETLNAFNYVIYNEHHHTGLQRPNQYSSINGFLELDEPKCWLAKKATASLLSL